MTIIIDQDRIDAPDFPRSQEWWQRFVPIWVTATVRDDGAVLLEASAGHVFTRTATGRKPLAPAVRRRRAAAMVRWIRNLPWMSAAIREES